MSARLTISCIVALVAEGTIFCPCLLQRHEHASFEAAERQKEFERVRMDKDRESFEAAQVAERLQNEVQATIAVSVRRADCLPESDRMASTR